MTTPVHDLDQASTTRLRPVAREAMIAALDDVQGDPSRVHGAGMAARALLETAREDIAAALGARPRSVLLTSGATEAIVTASRGVTAGHQVVTAVEHSAVRLSAGAGPVTEVAVDRTGRVDPDAVLDAVRPDTTLVHVQWGNHEVGTRQPVEEIVERAREAGVLVHVDAAQAAGREAVDFGTLGADLVSVSGHKLGGPPGSGALLIRRGLRLRPLLVGGDQELGRRGGIENTPAIAGFAAALRAAVEEQPDEAARQRGLADRLRSVLADTEGVELFGHPDHRLPHIVAAGIADVEPQAVLFGLDRRGIAVHSGSACASADLEPSPVLAAMGVDAHHSLRVSVGWSSTDEDVEAFAGALPEVLSELRALRR